MAVAQKTLEVAGLRIGNALPLTLFGGVDSTRAIHAVQGTHPAVMPEAARPGQRFTVVGDEPAPQQ